MLARGQRSNSVIGVLTLERGPCSELCVYTSNDRGSSPSMRAVSSGFKSGLAFSTHSLTVSADGLSFGNKGSASPALSGIVPVATTIVA